MAAPLSKIRETLESFRSSEKHPLSKWPIPDSIAVPVPPSEKDAAIILDDDTMAWHGMECKDNRRGDDLSSLPLSLQRNYWLAQMNLRFIWTLYCESFSPPVNTVVDLTSSAESDAAVPATATHKTSPSHELIEETTIIRWLEYWTAKRRTQRTHSSNARNESSFPESDGEEESVVLSKRRLRSETPKKPIRRNGHRGRRRKNSYDDDDDDNDDEEEYVYEDMEEDQDYFTASDSMPRSAISVRSRNIVTDEKALSPIDSLSIVLIIQGPVSSGKTSLVHSTASRMVRHPLFSRSPYISPRTMVIGCECDRNQLFPSEKRGCYKETLLRSCPLAHHRPSHTSSGEQHRGRDNNSRFEHFRRTGRQHHSLR